MDQLENGLFEPFDLTVYLGPDSMPWISASSRVGAIHGIPRKSASLPNVPDLLDMVHDYADDVQFAESQPEPELSKILGELIFGNPAVAELFQATRGVAAERGRQVLFRILASAELSVLPWELLPDPAALRLARRPYLALAPDINVVRQARGRTYTKRPELLEAPLNLLLVLSSPTPETDKDEWLSFDIFEVKQNLLSELEILQKNGLLRIDVEDRPTPDNLRRRIGAQRRGYHLFHYVGHAVREGLILEDRAGYRENMSAAKLTDLLSLCPDLRLAVFAGCETARAPSIPSKVDPQTGVAWKDLLSLADHCVQRACPAVIGMQAVLPFSAERVFTRFFYQALASGYTTAESLRLARGAIRADRQVGGKLLDWSVPALFIGADEPGAILPRSAPIPAIAPQRRNELSLGLRQRSSQFFGRDLALRQAVDVISGRTSERILVVTGVSSVGKSSLVHRALEEIGKDPKRLYVSFDSLAVDIDQSWTRFVGGRFPNLKTLCNLKVHNPLEELCRLTNELLIYSGAETRIRDKSWGALGWWKRLVEDSVPHQFVLVIDNVGVLDLLQQALLERLLQQLLSDYVDKLSNGNVDQSQILKRLTTQLSQLEKATIDQDTLTALWKKNKIPTEALDKLSDRLRVKSAELYLKALNQRTTASDRKVQSHKGATQRAVTTPSLDSLSAALCRLDAIRMSLGSALGILADRRSPRLVVTTSTPLRDFFWNVPDNMIFEMRLAPLTWSETWRSIRRSLPGLLRFGEDSLSRLWGRFGAQLERWEELERLTLKQSDEKVNLLKLSEKIVPPYILRSRPVLEGSAQRGHRPLRIAIAGPYIAGPRQVADALTQLATEYGGRVVFDPGEAGAFATLIDVRSPFSKKSVVQESDIVNWLEQVKAREPDIILLDYGKPVRVTDLKKETDELMLLKSIYQRTLLIAAGGNKLAWRSRKSWEGLTTIPAAYREVLSVGALDDEGEVRTSNLINRGLRKPNIFMTSNLAPTALARALKPKFENWVEGSGSAALHAVATAGLVWSLLPDLQPGEIRELLIDASRPISKARVNASKSTRNGKVMRALALEDALELARGIMVEKTLNEGPSSLQTLSAITGLDGRVLAAILEGLIKKGRVVRLATGRLERFQLLGKQNPQNKMKW
jgi:CHAT domain/AAA ATPase domain/Subtilase family